MNQDFVLGLALPITLFLIMFSMGSTLVAADFRRLATRPLPVVVGLSSQLLLLPLLALVLLAPLPMSPEIYAGFVILALSPGGTTSNVFSYLAGGNVALSITLTALVSLLAPFTLPFAANLLLADLAVGGQAFSLPLLPTVMRLLVVTVLPLSLGMVLRYRCEGFCRRYEAALTRVPFCMLLLVIAGIIVQNWPRMPEFLAMTGVPSLVLASGALLLAWVYALLWRLDTADRRTVAIETSIQNGGTAMLVTGTLLGNAEMTVAPVMYGIIMLLPVLLLVASQRMRSGLSPVPS